MQVIEHSIDPIAGLADRSTGVCERRGTGRRDAPVCTRSLRG